MNRSEDIRMNQNDGLSASNTISNVARREVPPDEPDLQAQMKMIDDLFRLRFTPDWQDETGAKRAYEQHNEAVVLRKLVEGRK